MLIQTVQYFGCLVASALSGASFESIISGEFTSHLTLLGQGLTAAGLGIPLSFAVVKFLWRRPRSWVRFSFDGKLLVYGFIFGMAIAVISLLAVAIFGSVNIVATPDRLTGGELVSILLGALGSVAFVAILEELVFRGMAVREWALKFGWPVATLLGGIYFGVAHILGLLPKLDIISIIWIIIASIIGSLLFVALYLRAKSLWLPIGFHAGWNLCLQTVLGVTMSGKDTSFGLYSIETSGNALITGGIFGLEASVGVMVLTAAIAVALLRYSKKGKPNLLSSKEDEPSITP